MRFYVNYLGRHFPESHILIADEPKKHNIMAIDGVSEGEAMRRVRIGSADLERAIRRQIPDEFEKYISVHNWSSFNEIGEYKHNLEVLGRAYEVGGEFRDDCDEFVRKFLACSTRRIAGGVERALSIAMNYLLEELAMLNAVETQFSDSVTEIYHGRHEIQEKAHAGGYEEITGLILDSGRRFKEVHADKPAVRVGDKAGVGKTLYANSDFWRGEEIFRIEGKLVREPTRTSVPVKKDLFVEPDNEGRYLCHSCEPSAGVKDGRKIVAFRDIVAGEEVSVDYAMIVNRYRPTQGFEQDLLCRCESDSCRGVLGSYDNLSDEIREKYRGFVSEYLVGGENE